MSMGGLVYPGRLEPIQQHNQRAGDEKERNDDRDDEQIHPAPFSVVLSGLSVPEGESGNRDFYRFYMRGGRIPAARLQE
jgi:hypothetical protein